MELVKTEGEIEKIRIASRIAAETLVEVKKLVEIGITTLEIDRFAEKLLREKGGTPAFKGYRGYKFTTCISVNEEVVHGLPSTRCLQEGEIVGIDIGAKFEGFYGDTAATFPVGKVEKKREKLIRITKEALYLGIAQAVAGKHLGDISSAIQSHAERNRFSVVRDLFGHGIGDVLHADPLIPNYGKKGTGLLLKAGMVFAIEPMLTEKGYNIEVKDDGWTIVTSDGGWSGHFEHTILITDNQPEILTEVK